MNYKKAYIITVLALISIQLMAQDKNFILKGKLANVKGGSKIYLFTFDEQVKRDSATVQNGTFEFKGKLNGPIWAKLILLHDSKPSRQPLLLNTKLDSRSLYLDEGVVNINASDSVKNLMVTGSKINDEDKNLSKSLDLLQKKMESLKAEFKLASPEEQKDEAFVKLSTDKLIKLRKEIEAAKINFAKSYPDSYVSLNTISELMASRTKDFNGLDTAYRLLSNRYKNSALGKKTEQNILYGVHTDIGGEAFDFVQPDANGKPYKLSDFRGKYLLIDFWASWCGPCRKECPNLVKAYEKYKDKNFTIMAVSVDEDRKKWLDAVKEEKLPYLQVSDLMKNHKNAAANLYRVFFIPASYLIDPNGKIIAKNLRGEALNKKLSELLD